MDPAAAGVGRILGVELWLLAAVAFFVTLVRLKSATASQAPPPVERHVFLTADIIIAFVYLIFAASQQFGAGRPVFGLSVAMPGSLASRFSFLGLDPAGRRLVEPVLLALLAAIFGKAVCSPRGAGAGRRALLFEAWVVLLLIESLEALLTVRFPAHADSLRIAALDWFRFVILQGVIYAGAADLLWWSRAAEGEARGGLRIAGRMTAGYLAALGAAAIFTAGAGFAAEPLRIGAHYYTWFPENWKHGYFWKELDPPSGPQLGEYASGAPEVVSRHITWAREAGVSFFVLDWWPARRMQRAAALATFNSPEAADFLFSVQLETMELKDARDKRVPGEGRDVVVLTPKRTERLIRSVDYIAQELMTQPQYLRIDGRPVLFLYASRHLAGPVAQALAELRAAIRKKHGFDLYLVGDEVYEHVVGTSPRGMPILLSQFEPNWDRIAAFDAITCYNPYVAEHKEFGGIEGSEKFLDFGARLYERYSAVANTLGIPFYPGVMPGYNDRGVRAKENHYVVPRSTRGLEPLGIEGQRSFLIASLARWGAPFLDRRLPMLLVTSWNEWNEGTNIEPTVISPQTNDDSSGPARAYTAGEFFGGGGCGDLDDLEWIRGWLNLGRIGDYKASKNGPFDLYRRLEQ